MTVICEYQNDHFDGVEALWAEAFPDDSAWNVACVAIPEKLRHQPELIWVAVENDRVIGSIMAGYDGHRGWIARIAVSRTHQRKGIGEALILTAERALAALGCLKINLQVVQRNSAVVDFYRRVGYNIEERISMSKVLKRD